MKVHVVLADFGVFDGGASIMGIYKDHGEAVRHQQAAQQENGNYPEYRIEEHEIVI